MASRRRAASRHAGVGATSRAIHAAARVGAAGAARGGAAGAACAIAGAATLAASAATSAAARTYPVTPPPTACAGRTRMLAGFVRRPPLRLVTAATFVIFPLAVRATRIVTKPSRCPLRCGITTHGRPLR